MLKKHSRLLKFTAFLISVAPVVASRSCAYFFIGEPKLPRKLKK